MPPVENEDDEGVLQRALEETRFGMYNVPRHLRERLNTVARMLRVSQTEALGACIQAAEAAMDEATAQRYMLDLRRALCSPEGTTARTPIIVAMLPELPEAIAPAIGVGMRRSELHVYEPASHMLDVTAKPTKAQQIIQARMAELRAQGLLPPEEEGHDDDGPDAA
jgi:hypothetical protein